MSLPTNILRMVLLIEMISLLESAGVLSSAFGIVSEATPQAIILFTSGLYIDSGSEELITIVLFLTVIIWVFFVESSALTLKSQSLPLSAFTCFILPLIS